MTQGEDYTMWLINYLKRRKTVFFIFIIFIILGTTLLLTRPWGQQTSNIPDESGSITNSDSTAKDKSTKTNNNSGDKKSGYLAQEEIPKQPPATGDYSYGEALQKAIFFMSVKVRKA